MAGSDFITNDRFMSRYLPVTNRDENGRTPAVQALEDRIDYDATVEDAETWLPFGQSAPRDLHEAFRDT